MFSDISQMVRFLSVGCVLAIVVACLGGCGGGTGGDAVVRVGGNSITRATVDHWTAIQSIISGGVPPQSSVPKGLAPDPPRYTACIGYLRAMGATGTAGGGAPPASLLKRECRQRQEDARRRVLAILITFQWLLGESKAQHMTVSNDEVAKDFARHRQNFPSDAAFQAYLRSQGKSVADESLILKNDLLFRLLEQKIVAKEGAAAAARFFQGLPKKWAAKTSCIVGYVVPNCMQYRGSASPELMT